MVVGSINKVFKKNLFSLSGYMVVSIVIIHILLIPVLYYTLLTSYYENASEQFINHNNEVAGMLSDVLSKKNPAVNHNEIIDILNSAILGSKITYLQLEESTGNVIKAQDSDFSRHKFIEDKNLNEHFDNVFYMVFPVYFQGVNDISYLKIGFDELAINEEFNAVKFSIAIILIVYFIAVLLLVIGLIRVIHKPIYYLRNQSKEIVNGNLDLPLTTNSRLKEIKHLTEDLDLMRSSLVGLAERMQYKATHDDLTDLPNRYLFNDRLQYSIHSSERDKREFAILLLDLDHFKEINDTLGHSIGDEVLKVTGLRMLEGLRDSDTISRIGGDEFAFILMNVNSALAEKLAKKIIQLIQPILNINNHALKVSASIGISIYPTDGSDPDLLMRRADVAMYNAKHNNLQISLYHCDMDNDHYEKLMLINDLKSSIDADYFEALVQAKFDLLTGKPCGCELLLRWNHPDLGVIYPNKFIPLAERENLIADLTCWLMRNCLHEFLYIVNENPDFHVAINVSPMNLLDNALFKSICEILKISGFPKTSLYIEVTENAIMKNPLRSIEVLNKFNDEGIGVSVDDFGTGYSSLSYLQKFPISELKIDKSFILNLNKESNNYPIVTATITMAHDLGIQVVAEGVENKSAIGLLKEMGCDRVQGFYFSRPLNMAEFKQWYSKF